MISANIEIPMIVAMRLLAVIVAGELCLAQTPAPVTFEVASVHVASSTPPYTPIPAAGEIRGGPGTADPTHVTYTWVLVRRLLMESFGLPLDQILGSDWVMGQDARFNISAIVPAGATKEQAREMLLNLLKERFDLTYHTEKKDFDLYALGVAKGGPKLKEAAPATGPLPEAPKSGTIAVAAPLDRDGFPQLPAGRNGIQGRTENGVTRMTFKMATPQQLANMLQAHLRPSRVVDKTGLTGSYDFYLEFSTAGLPGPMGRGPAPSPDGADQAQPAPNLFSALEKQLGLKLEKSKTPLDVIVIDHMNKQPTQN